jgi:hypothetical protein
LGSRRLKLLRDRIAHEALYVMEDFDAAEWRSEWATMFDPLASVAAGE